MSYSIYQTPSNNKTRENIIVTNMFAISTPPPVPRFTAYQNGSAEISASNTPSSFSEMALH